MALVQMALVHLFVSVASGSLNNNPCS